MFSDSLESLSSVLSFLLPFSCGWELGPGGRSTACASPSAGRLHTTCSIQWAVPTNCGSVSVELCAAQGYFSRFVNILDLGPHRWWETMGWDSTGLFRWEVGSLRGTQQDFLFFIFFACLNPFTRAHVYITPDHFSVACHIVCPHIPCHSWFLLKSQYEGYFPKRL